MQTTTRHASLEDLARLLQDQHGRKLDVVAPATSIRAVDGNLVLSGVGEALLDDTGVTVLDGVYRPTETCDSGIASKLGIPGGYLRRLRENRPDLYDANVNGWLAGWTDELAESFPQALGLAPHPRIEPDPRSFLIRCFKGNDGEGIARAFLSDRYGIIDHLDVLTAALDGIAQSGVNVQVTRCDLTPDRMYVQVAAPQIAAYAPALLAGYRSPFDGREVGRGWTPEAVARAAGGEGQQLTGEPPVVFAGFVLTNSETGGGAFCLTPQLIVKVCNNGLTITADAMRGVHLGGRLEEGVVRWSRSTQHKALELITARAADAVATYLDVAYVTRQVAKLERDAGTPVEDPQKTIEVVSSALQFTEAQRTLVLSHFIKGGQLTAGGVMQAVTSAAQLADDADTQFDMEAAGVRAMALAVAAQGRPSE